MSLDHLIQKIYLDLFQEDAKNTFLNLTLLERDLNRVKDKSEVLQFSDWANLSDINKY